jgi:DNA polymerase
VADFSAIEARVVAWLAGEKWVLDTFRQGKGIYEATAARMYNVPEDTIVKGNSNYEYRQKGKQAVLACGYSGGVGALKSMGADMSEDDMKGLVQAWRAANPNIVKFWYAVEKTAKKAIKDKTSVECGYVRFSYESAILFITLPSGRRLAYIKPRLDYDDRFNKDCITYEGIEQKSWTRLHTYGGKLVENIVQATARDILAEAIINVSIAGYNIVMHCHDEIITDTPIGFGSVQEICEIMSKPPNWAEGLPLSAAGFQCEYYKKE